MYSDVFCKVYNEFGWNYYPEAFGEQLLQWIERQGIPVRTALDLACGTGVLCRILQKAGIESRGMDFSSGMIDIARQESPDIPYDVTHLVRTFSNKINRARKEIEVGWGKYYGPMVEHGTVKMRSREHLKPLYERNADKYSKLMMMKFYN